MIEERRPGLTTPKQQVFKLGLAVAVEGDDLAIEHG
jgi:hypothetical protein